MFGFAVLNGFVGCVELTLSIDLLGLCLLCGWVLVGLSCIGIWVCVLIFIFLKFDVVV